MLTTVLCVPIICCSEGVNRHSYTTRFSSAQLARNVEYLMFGEFDPYPVSCCKQYRVILDVITRRTILPPSLFWLAVPVPFDILWAAQVGTRVQSHKYQV